MASVTLTDVWLHDAGDLSSYVKLSAESIEEVAGAQAPIRRYAGGRFRMVTYPGVQKSYSITFGLLTRSEANSVRSWSGRLLLMRDPLGRATFGRYQDPRISEIPITSTDTVYAVSVTFDEVTHSVEV